MVIDTKDIFTLDIGRATGGRPYFNENQKGALSTSSTFLADRKTLMNWIKRTSEAIGILRQISVDVITKISFVAVERGPTVGRPKQDDGTAREEKAKIFAANNFLKQQLRAMLIEGVGVGDSYMWKGKVENNKIKEMMIKNLKKLGLNVEVKEIKSSFIDEDFVGEKTLQYVPTTTMDIKVHESGTKIEFFVQRTRLNDSRVWKPEDILHYKFMEFDGKVHGYTPNQANFPIIKTLGAIKDYHGHWFESGITPDIVFNFEEMDPNSAEYTKMQQIVQEWYDNKRRSHLITTSKMNIETLNKWDKDMEFRFLAIW